MKMKTLGMAVAASCLFIGFAAADVFMKGADVAKIVAGNTVEGKYQECTAGGRDFVEFYTTDGKIRGQERNCNQSGNWMKYAGTWEVNKDGKFCVALGSGRTSGCFNYQVDKDRLMRRVDPKGIDVIFTITDGNTRHL